MSEGVLRQFRSGYLSEESWSEYERTLVGMLQTPIVKEWFNENHSPFSREFRDHIESMIDSTVHWRPKATPGLSRPGTGEWRVSQDATISRHPQSKWK